MHITHDFQEIQNIIVEGDVCTDIPPFMHEYFVRENKCMYISQDFINSLVLVNISYLN